MKNIREINDIIELRKNGKTLKEIASIKGVTKQAISVTLIQNGISGVLKKRAPLCNCGCGKEKIKAGHRWINPDHHHKSIGLKADVTKELLDFLYNDRNMTLQEIADELGVVFNTAFRYMEMFDVKRIAGINKAITRGTIPDYTRMGHPVKLKDSDLESIKSLYDDNNSVQDIADIMKVSRNTIIRFLERHQIPLRHATHKNHYNVKIKNKIDIDWDNLDEYMTNRLAYQCRYCKKWFENKTNNPITVKKTIRAINFRICEFCK
jgi:predicted DNA-binding protein YlxM (UPF0122 family)